MNWIIPENPRLAKAPETNKVALSVKAELIFLFSKLSLKYSLNTIVKEIAVVRQAKKIAIAAITPPEEPKTLMAID